MSYYPRKKCATVIATSVRKCEVCARLEKTRVRCIVEGLTCEGLFTPTCERRFTCATCFAINRRKPDEVAYTVETKPKSGGRY